MARFTQTPKSRRAWRALARAKRACARRRKHSSSFSLTAFRRAGARFSRQKNLRNFPKPRASAPKRNQLFAGKTLAPARARFFCARQGAPARQKIYPQEEPPP